MPLSYAPDADGFHIELTPDAPAVADGREVPPELHLYDDERGYVVGLSLFDASAVLRDGSLEQITVEGLTAIVRQGEPASEYQRDERGAVLLVEREPVAQRQVFRRTGAISVSMNVCIRQRRQNASGRAA